MEWEGAQGLGGLMTQFRFLPSPLLVQWGKTGARSRRLGF